jgi:2-hydroxychromene-2-carboxylate isomerase
MAKLEFYYDFGSPNCYLAWRVLPEIVARTGAELVHFPVLLGGVFKATGNRSPAESLAGIKNKLAYEHLELQRFIARHGLSEYRFNPHFPINTLQLMRGAVAAGHLGVAGPYRAAIYAGMWERGLKLDDLEVLGATLAEAGLPAQKLMVAVMTDAVKQELIANTELAVRRGAFGAPTFFVGEEIYFGKDKLREVEDALG